MTAIWYRHILPAFAILILVFQNCARPQDISQNATVASQKIHEELQLISGQSVSLTLPLEDTILDPDFNWTQVEVEWLWITSTGQRHPINNTGFALELHDLNRREAGTYRAIAVFKDQEYIFNYRIQIMDNFGLNSNQRGSYYHEYINSPCQQGLDTQAFYTENVRFSEAQEACLAAQSASQDQRQQRGLICRFNGVAFHSSPSALPRADFLAQQRPATSSRYQDIFQVEEVTQCTARIECRDFIDLQIRTGNASSAAVIRCYWGDDLVSPFG